MSNKKCRSNKERLYLKELLLDSEEGLLGREILNIGTTRLERSCDKVCRHFRVRQNEIFFYLEECKFHQGWGVGGDHPLRKGYLLAQFKGRSKFREGDNFNHSLNNKYFIFIDQ